MMIGMGTPSTRSNMERIEVLLIYEILHQRINL
jgi:hypothetical protein